MIQVSFKIYKKEKKKGKKNFEGDNTKHAARPRTLISTIGALDFHTYM